MAGGCNMARAKWYDQRSIHFLCWSTNSCSRLNEFGKTMMGRYWLQGAFRLVPLQKMVAGNEHSFNRDDEQFFVRACFGRVWTWRKVVDGNKWRKLSGTLSQELLEAGSGWIDSFIWENRNLNLYFRAVHEAQTIQANLFFHHDFRFQLRSQCDFVSNLVNAQKIYSIVLQKNWCEFLDLSKWKPKEEKYQMTIMSKHSQRDLPIK